MPSCHHLALWRWRRSIAMRPYSVSVRAAQATSPMAYCSFARVIYMSALLGRFRQMWLTCSSTSSSSISFDFISLPTLLKVSETKSLMASLSSLSTNRITASSSPFSTNTSRFWACRYCFTRLAIRSLESRSLTVAAAGFSSLSSHSSSSSSRASGLFFVSTCQHSSCYKFEGRTSLGLFLPSVVL